MSKHMPAVRLDSLTGLRFFAALMVFGRHTAETGVLDMSDGVLNFLKPGLVGVSFFYIVSGFVLAWTARPNDGAGSFYRRRFARIYPAYFVAWISAIGILVFREEALGWKEFFPLTLLQAWLPDSTIYFGASVVFWSLSCEAFFYIVFPLIHPALVRLKTNHRMRMMAGVVIAVFLVASIVHAVGMTPAGHWFLYFFPPVRLLEFVLGILLAHHLKENMGGRIIPLGFAVPLAVMGFGIAAVVPESFMSVAITVVPFSVLVYSAAQTDLARRASVFRWRPIVTLGVWSYCFYLVHVQVVFLYFAISSRLMRFEVETLAGIPLVVHLVVALVLSVTAAAALHLAVEKPFERWLRPKSRGPRLDDDRTRAKASART
jgi:peptidoglycan/LPS O-acetylase OafA/YrhL